MKFTAKVIKGGGKGKKIGFPTANLDNTNLKLDYGVYLAKAEINSKVFSALLHFGPKKTFNNKKISCEIHLIGFDLDIYGKNVIITTMKKIRDVVKFASVEELKKQIRKDITQANPESKILNNKSKIQYA